MVHTMFNTKIQYRNKRASIAAFDLLFSTIIVISFLLPILDFGSHAVLVQQHKSANSQKLSSLLQISEHFYSNLASQNTSHMLDIYTHPGILDTAFDAQNKYDFSYMGLEDFEIHFSEPTIHGKNQFCIRRLMRSGCQTTKIWFCAR